MGFYSDLFNNQIWYWLYIQNWNFIIKGYPANVLLIALWSLAVEEQFYIFWPFCFRYLKFFNRKLIIFALLACSVGLRILLTDAWVAYLSTLTAFEPLLLGALICILEKEGKLQRIRKVLLIFTIFSFIGLAIILSIDKDLTNQNALLIKFGYSFIDCIWVFLLFQTVSRQKYSGYRTRVLEFKCLIWLGTYSYGIYIFHWIILQTFVFRYQFKMNDFGLHPALSYIISRMGGILLVLLCSYFSYHWYETKFLRLKKYFI
jgi:peptidoglycan/LPS O-acetylase OafA/YrhL